MTRSTALLALAVAVVVFLTGCGDSAETSTTSATTTSSATSTTLALTPTTNPSVERSFVGADGVETTITDVSRIVSLNGDLTEIIFELGFGDNVVGVDVTTTYPPEAAALNNQGQTVGFAQQLAPEAVLRFEPTLVIGDQQVGPSEVTEQLRAAGIPVVILTTQTTLDGVETKILDVAEILGVPEEGAVLADRVLGEIDAARDLAAGDDSDPKVAFVYVRGPQVVFLFGAGTPTQAMIEGAGAIDAGAGAGVAGPAPLTPEALVAAAPEVIVLPRPAWPHWVESRRSSSSPVSPKHQLHRTRRFLPTTRPTSSTWDHVPARRSTNSYATFTPASVDQTRRTRPSN